MDEKNYDAPGNEIDLIPKSKSVKFSGPFNRNSKVKKRRVKNKKARKIRKFNK